MHVFVSGTPAIEQLIKVYLTTYINRKNTMEIRSKFVVSDFMLISSFGWFSIRNGVASTLAIEMWCRH